jgi:ribose 1,5-bisphosphokinase PhnN
VRELYDALRALGLSIFLDERQLEVGDSIYSSLNASLDASEFVVFCISRESVASGWVGREVGGSLVKQVKGQRKRLLPVLLDDAPIPSLLSDLVWLDMTTASPAEVAAQIRSAITSARESSLRASTFPRDVREQVDSVFSLLAGWRADPGFCWVIISGPSSAGKDVLSYIAVQRLQQRYGLSFLRKTTTRPRRPSEPDYVEQVNEVEFERRCRAGEIMFPFRKRTFRYGFDGKQFREALREGSPLLSVFTEFRLVPALVEAMNAAGVRTTSFLIHTEKADVLRRVLFRNLPPDEVASRVASIEQDYYEMNRRPTLEHEYTFINNGDARAFSDASTELVEAIQSMIESNTSVGSPTMGFKTDA